MRNNRAAVLHILSQLNTTVHTGDKRNNGYTLWSMEMMVSFSFFFFFFFFLKCYWRLCCGCWLMLWMLWIGMLVSLAAHLYKTRLRTTTYDLQFTTVTAYITLQAPTTFLVPVCTICGIDTAA